MDDTESSSSIGAGGGRHSIKVPIVEPLTRSGYVRLARVERQIEQAAALEKTALVVRARQRDECDSSFLAPEAIIYFIRQAIRIGDVRFRDDLFRELLERCNPHFRGKFRGFGREDREDLQGEVQRMIIEDLFAQDDRSDFMQVRFWTYLERKCIDACRAALRQTANIESLDTGHFGDSVSEGLTKIDQEIDRQLPPEEFAIISAGLELLPPRLRRVFLLRHYVGLKIGSDNLSNAEGKELTIAAQFGCTGRTIRNWLKEADRLLADFREKHHGN